MKVFLVCATNKVVHMRDGQVGNDFDGLGSFDGAEITRLAAEVLDDFCFGGKAKAFVQTGEFAGFDFIELMVAT